MTATPFQLECAPNAPAVTSEPPCAGSLDLRLGDCMDVMATFPDGHFDLAIVDPPYGIGVNSMNMGSRKTVRPDKKNWDDEIPTPEYFAELRRVAKKQIVWGGELLPAPAVAGLVRVGQGRVDVWPELRRSGTRVDVHGCLCQNLQNVAETTGSLPPHAKACQAL